MLRIFTLVIFLLLSSLPAYAQRDDGSMRAVRPDIFDDMPVETGPSRNEQPTRPHQWFVGKVPNPDSKPLLQGWSDVAAIRFWLWLDKPYASDMTLVLTGSPVGYFSASVSLNFAGWKQLVVPIDQFAANAAPSSAAPSLNDTTSLGFRTRGHGQSALPESAVWWVDGVELQPRPGKTLMLEGDLEGNKAAWSALAAQGNPFYVLNEQHYKPPQPAFRAPATITNAWRYRNIAEDLYPEAFQAGNPSSPSFDRPDLVAHVVATIDWLIASCDAQGWWWKPKPNFIGDPNVNRFTLEPLLDSVNWILSTPEGKQAWPRWQPKLRAAIDLQRQSAQHKNAWDWAPIDDYVNQDAYYMLILALSGQLFHQPADTAQAAAMMQKIEGRIFPDGGWPLIDKTNEVAIYHGLDLILISRYATLTNSEQARATLRKTVRYWPLSVTAEGYGNFYSDPVMKHVWTNIDRSGFVVAAGATRDPQNQALMRSVLDRSRPAKATMSDLYAAPYWTGVDPGKSLPDSFVVPDQNIRGFRGRSGSWYFSAMQGRSMSDSIVGGLITQPVSSSPLLAAFRGAQIEVMPEAGANKRFWLMWNEPNGMSLRPGHSGAIGVTYRLLAAPPAIPPPAAPPPSPWVVTQSWRAAAEGVIGLIHLEATENTSAASITGRIGLGPDPVVSLGPNLWRSGPLSVKLLQYFGEAGVEPVVGYAPRAGAEWEGIAVRKKLNGVVEKGASFTYAVWVGPTSQAPPRDFTILPDGRSWKATLADGHQVANIVNSMGASASYTLPWTEPATPQLYDGDGKATGLSVVHGKLNVKLNAGQTGLIEE